MIRVFVSAGSNIEPERHLASGLSRLSAVARITALSSVYRSPAEGRPDQPDYLNLVIGCLIGSHRVKGEFDALLKDIEAAEGRVRTGDRFASRTLDLDIISFGAAFSDPRIPLRDFLWAPLLEIDPVYRLDGHGGLLSDIVGERGTPNIERLETYSEELRRSVLE